MADIFLFLEALMHLALARLMVLVLPLRWVLGFSGSRVLGPVHPEEPRTRGPENLLPRIRWALLAAARRAPWRCQCLEQSIAGKLMLRRRRIPATLYLGVEKTEDAIHAHAWLRCGSTFVTGGDGSTRYSIVSVLG